MSKYNKKIDELLEVIQVLDTLYEDGSDCIDPRTGNLVTDTTYDQWKQELIDLLQENDPTHEFLQQPSISSLDSGVKKIKHDPPMTSINKANGSKVEKNKILDDWINKIVTELGYDNKSKHEVIAQSFKRDGVAIALYYENGKLVKAGLRPQDGINGEDVTENAKYVQGIPETLREPVTCSIRGELECKISVFEEINNEQEKNGEKTYANPRNYTAGSIRQFKNPIETKKRRLNFTAYSIENLDSPPYKTAIERAKWCNNVLGIPFVRVEPFNIKDLEKMESLVDTLDYEVDGAVLEVNNLEDQEQLGKHGNSTTGNPKGKLAWKFSEKSVIVTINNVVWNTGRQGKITPVVEFYPTRIAGTMVKRCTAHNVGIMKSKKLGVGAEIGVIKSGKIIPKIISVEKEAKTVEIPSVCPSCNYKVIEESSDNAMELFCRNQNCPAQNVGRLYNFLNVIGCKGVADSTVTKLVERKLVTNCSDFYKLDFNQLKQSGFTERQSALIIANIAMVADPDKIKDCEDLLNKAKSNNKIKTSMQQFIAALGIPGASKGTGRTLSVHFKGDFDKVRNASVEDLKLVEDIGGKTAENVFVFFKSYCTEVDELLKYIELEKAKEGKLSGKSFVFTGTFEEKRRDLEQMVENLGGKASNSVSKKVNYVVVGQDAGSKAEKAEKLKITTLNIDEFYEIIK